MQSDDITDATLSVICYLMTSPCVYNNIVSWRDFWNEMSSECWHFSWEACTLCSREFSVRIFKPHVCDPLLTLLVTIFKSENKSEQWTLPVIKSVLTHASFVMGAVLEEYRSTTVSRTAGEGLWGEERRHGETLYLLAWWEMLKKACTWWRKNWATGHCEVTNTSQGSVTTRSLCGGIFSDDYKKFTVESRMTGQEFDNRFAVGKVADKSILWHGFDSKLPVVWFLRHPVHTYRVLTFVYYDELMHRCLKRWYLVSIINSLCFGSVRLVFKDRFTASLKCCIYSCVFLWRVPK